MKGSNLKRVEVMAISDRVEIGTESWVHQLESNKASKIQARVPGYHRE